MILTTHLHCLAVLLSSVLVHANNANTRTSSTIQCSTQRGTHSTNHVTTCTSTTTTHPPACRITKTSTPVTTVTGPRSTVTCTSTHVVTTTTTLIAVTDSITNTITSTSTAGATVTSTETVTNTETDTVFETAHTPTAAGFLPILDTTASAYPGSKKRRAGRFDVNALFGRSSTQPNSQSLTNSYPERVQCVDKVYIETTSTFSTTAKHTETKTVCGKTTTVSARTTVTSTSTVVPPEIKITLAPVTVTATITTTSTDDITVTATATTTETLTVPAVTANYDACATDSRNFLGPQVADGNYITGVGGLDFQRNFILATDQVDCCNMCQATPGCRGSLYALNNIYLSCVTFVSTSEQCQPQSQGPIPYDEGRSTGETFVLSNGPCGYLYDENLP